MERLDDFFSILFNSNAISYTVFTFFVFFLLSSFSETVISWMISGSSKTPIVSTTSLSQPAAPTSCSSRLCKNRLRSSRTAQS